MFFDDPPSGMSNLTAALQALRDISVNNSGTRMTHEEWDYVVDICVFLNPVVTVFGSRDALRDLDHIHYQATQWRDR